MADDDQGSVRDRSQRELEHTLISQEQQQEQGTGVPIVEQVDDIDDTNQRDEGVVTAGQGQGSGYSGMGADGAGEGIVSPGAGTDVEESVDERDRAKE